MTRFFSELNFGLFILAAFGLLLPAAAFGQTEKLGIVSYTPPKGWTKQAPPQETKATQEDLVVYSHVNKTTGTFCMITLRGATTGTGNPTDDFDAVWNNIVSVKPFDEAAEPRKLPAKLIDGWTINTGGSKFKPKGKSNGNATTILLTVFSGFGKAFSVVVLSDDKAYKPQVDAFWASIGVDKPKAPGSASHRTGTNTSKGDSNEEPPPPPPWISAANTTQVKAQPTSNNTTMPPNAGRNAHSNDAPEHRVQSFYGWYLKSINSKQDPAKDKAVMNSHLSERFSRWFYSTAVQKANNDVFINRQERVDAWADHIDVGEAVSVIANEAMLKVKLGTPPDDGMTLLIFLVKEGGKWKIDGIKVPID